MQQLVCPASTDICSPVPHKQCWRSTARCACTQQHLGGRFHLCVRCCACNKPVFTPSSPFSLQHVIFLNVRGDSWLKFDGCFTRFPIIKILSGGSRVLERKFAWIKPLLWVSIELQINLWWPHLKVCFICSCVYLSCLVFLWHIFLLISEKWFSPACFAFVLGMWGCVSWYMLQKWWFMVCVQTPSRWSFIVHFRGSLIHPTHHLVPFSSAALFLLPKPTSCTSTVHYLCYVTCSRCVCEGETTWQRRERK